MKQKLIGIIILASLFIACLPFDNESKSCYRIKDGKVYLRYYGGYPRAKEVMRKLEGADAKSFEYIEGSREGACQGGDMFAKDKRQVFYRNRKVKFADPETFEAVLYGYSKDASNVFYMDSVIEKADAKSFFVIENKRKQPYAADKYGLIVRNKRIGGQVDAPSFELLSRPYSKDKNKVYYSEKFQVLDGADPESFTCPDFESIVNFQHYAFDKNVAYYYERGKVENIPNNDFETFKVLSTHYAKDKNTVYYKAKIMDQADPETFHVPHRINKRSGQDKKYSYFEGEIKDK